MEELKLIITDDVQELQACYKDLDAVRKRVTEIVCLRTKGYDKVIADIVKQMLCKQVDKAFHNAGSLILEQIENIVANNVTKTFG